MSTTFRTVNKAANASSYNAFTMRADALAYQESGGRPWGLAATLGLSLAIWYALELLQAAMGFGMDRVLAALRLVSPAQNTQALNFAVITCISTVLCGALVIAAAALRDRLDPRAYLGIVRAPAKEWLRWLGAMALIVAMTDLVIYLVKGELLPAQWVEIYRSVQSPLLFWIALVVATPIFEELLFRGFVFAGILASPLGRVGAVLITALAWTWIHYEFDPLEFAIIFIVGVTLGIARLRTGSLLVTMAMHMLYNLISTGEIIWLAAIADAQS
ncbi:MAG: CPBP family intramembrane metalloprotease [Betaproteobacteria bacterium]|nr:CPBP family intramembrane metalloprotease [Betaproteobacteria bacterium]